MTQVTENTILDTMNILSSVDAMNSLDLLLLQRGATTYNIDYDKFKLDDLHIDVTNGDGLSSMVLHTALAGLSSVAGSNESNISTLESTVSTNTGNIATNTGNIATNTGNIATNTGNIATLSSNVSTNTGNISTNTGNISTNTGNIATNTGNIATLSSNVSTNTTDIVNNSTNISNNTINSNYSKASIDNVIVEAGDTPSIGDTTTLYESIRKMFDTIYIPLTSEIQIYGGTDPDYTPGNIAEYNISDFSSKILLDDNTIVYINSSNIRAIYVYYFLYKDEPRSPFYLYTTYPGNITPDTPIAGVTGSSSYDDDGDIGIARIPINPHQTTIKFELSGGLNSYNVKIIGIEQIG